MRLYSGTSEQFIDDAIHNQIAEKLKNAYINHFRYKPPESEVESWRNSLRSMSQVFQYAKLMDHGVILEYQLPMTSRRLDCMICGRDKKNIDNAVIIELKQWGKCLEASGDNEVCTWIRGGNKDVLHPSVQVGQYHLYLKDTHTAFYDSSPVTLNACAYLHNYSFTESDVLLSKKFERQIKDYPIFSADDVDHLSVYLKDRLGSGKGLDVLNRVEKSRFRPSKKLMEHVASVIKDRKEYVLLDDQLIAFDSVLTAARKGFIDKQKSVIIIKGGPGTGKSVIAINLMAELLQKGFNAHYATGSKAFTETLRSIIGTRGQPQFKYFNSYIGADENAIDVLIADEAHRIRITSNNRFTPKSSKSNVQQIDELLHVSKVAVFLIDDNQVVRPNEIGSVQYIKDVVHKYKYRLAEYELEAQFRCNGSDAFVNWINNTLEIKKSPNVLWNQNDKFDFQICSSPLELELAIRGKAKEGFTARITAGFCWDWSDPDSEGQLVNDVVIGNYKRPWNAKPESRRLAKDIPKASLWAYDPLGLEQVGCIYTAQGFEFDYAGVIFGEDLTYDPDKAQWIGDGTKSFDSIVKRDRARFIEMVKNTYRVLLSRGLKGCYVYFMNKETERFFRSRMERRTEEEDLPVESIGKVKYFEMLPIVEKQRQYTSHLPVFALDVAAGGFQEVPDIKELGWAEVNIGRTLNKDMFIAKVVGKSMEPLIPDGSYCVFEKGVTGSRQGRVVLVQHHGITDPETGGSYTVKRYTSKKKPDEDQGWRHDEIVLQAENPRYKPIKIVNSSADEFLIVAELVDVIKS